MIKKRKSIVKRELNVLCRFCAENWYRFAFNIMNINFRNIQYHYKIKSLYGIYTFDFFLKHILILFHNTYTHRSKQKKKGCLL